MSGRHDYLKFADGEAEGREMRSFARCPALVRLAELCDRAGRSPEWNSGYLASEGSPIFVLDLL